MVGCRLRPLWPSPLSLPCATIVITDLGDDREFVVRLQCELNIMCLLVCTVPVGYTITYWEQQTILAVLIRYSQLGFTYCTVIRSKIIMTNNNK
jgi:hypothetical protein